MYVGKKNCNRRGGAWWVVLVYEGIAPPSHFPAGVKIRISCLNLALLGAQKWAEMLHHPSILGGPETNGDKIRICCLSPAFSGTHKWAEMLRQPCFLRDTQKRGQEQSIKKTEKNRKKTISHILLDPACCQADSPHWGLDPGPFSCRGTAFPLGYGSSLTHLCAGVVFIFGPIWFSSIIWLSSKN